MKTFEDLEFKDRRFDNIEQARMDFENGYSISVIFGEGTYCDNDGSNYEVAILRNGKITYNTPITDNVLSCQTPEQITAIMKEIQTYEKGL
jgi:hypothetical protein